jgi:hypothetical protein
MTLVLHQTNDDTKYWAAKETNHTLHFFNMGTVEKEYEG